MHLFRLSSTIYLLLHFLCTPLSVFLPHLFALYLYFILSAIPLFSLLFRFSSAKNSFFAYYTISLPPILTSVPLYGASHRFTALYIHFCSAFSDIIPLLFRLFCLCTFFFPLCLHLHPQPQPLLSPGTSVYRHLLPPLFLRLHPDTLLAQQISSVELMPLVK